MDHTAGKRCGTVDMARTLAQKLSYSCSTARGTPPSGCAPHRSALYHCTLAKPSEANKYSARSPDSSVCSGWLSRSGHFFHHLCPAQSLSVWGTHPGELQEGYDVQHTASAVRLDGT